MHVVLNRSTTDPLRLNATREAYRKTMQLRFDRIASLCRTSINKGALEVQQSNQGARAGNPAPPGSWSGPADIAIAHFQSWLASQTTSVVLDSENTVEQGPPRGHFTRTFTARAYLAGLTRAAEEARRLTLPSVPDLDTLLGTPRSTSAREILARRQYQLLIGITDDMAESMRKVMAEGFELGYERQQFVDALVKQAGLSKTRADALAVTEVTFANAEATLNAYQDLGVQRVTALVEFQTTSGNPCPECLALEGQIFTVEDARGIIPLHPRCFPAGVLVESAGSLVAASARTYSGDLLVIRTADGRRIPVTPNHPILTSRGFVPAKSIQQGDKIPVPTIAQRSALGVDNVNQSPSPIQNVANARLAVSSFEYCQTRDVFHGDGSDGEVGVVWTDGFLRDACHTHRLQALNEYLLSVALVKYLAFADDRRAALLLKRYRNAAPGCVGLCNKSPAFLGGHGSFRNRAFPLAIALSLTLSLRSITVAHQLCFSDGPDVNPMIHEQRPHDVPGYAVMQRDTLLGDAGLVSSDDLIRREYMPSVDRSPTDNVPVSSHQESADDGLLVAPKEISYFLDGHTGPVHFDRVVGVDVQLFRGHVYNLQTSSGFYLADGVPVHNCQCVWLPKEEVRRAA